MKWWVKIRDRFTVGVRARLTSEVGQILIPVISRLGCEYNVVRLDRDLVGH